MILIDGQPGNQIPADDRGLAYGDGVFRTLPLRGGIAPLWDRHYAKLAADCRALGITPPAEQDLRADLARIAGKHPDCAIRITVTRGSGGRGYAIPEAAQARRIVSASPLPDHPANWPRDGVSVRYCSTTLASQPRLAGIKHLNRLENVLARAEWQDAEIAEGLLGDSAGHLIEGTRCNLFIIEQGALVTPDLSACGVAGVIRQAMLETGASHGFSVRIDAINRARLEDADGLLLVNSLIGVWPVARLGERHWQGFSAAYHLQEWLDELAGLPG